MTSGAFPVAMLLVVAAILYVARDVLIPLALSILLSFLLAPAANLLERWKLGRAAATAIVVVLGFSIIGAVGWVAANQAIALAAKLPEYRENITAKIRALRGPQTGALGKAAEAIKELESEAAPSNPPVAVMETPASPIAALAEMAAPFVKPLGIALAVVVFTVLMLLKREDMRERLIALIGARRINVTTQALGEASEKVSRYLLMQLVVNASFGIPFGIALYFIGIPNAMLWGLLTTLLRFIPYGGIWVALALPLVLAFAISDGWSLVLWTLAVFLVLEVIFMYAVEPWLYGRSTGLSPIAVIAALLFWTWLWGPVGLLLAMPLTVCVAVLGRHIPQLGFLNVLLGVEPVLTPDARLYQRLIAGDDEQALDFAEDYAKEHGLTRLHEAVVIPALGLCEQDRHRGAIDAERERFVFDTVRRVVEEVDGDAEQSAAAPRATAAPKVCVAGAHDEADHLAGLALARLLPSAEFDANVITHPVLAAEIADQIAECGAKVLCISAVPPHAVMHASYLAKRAKRQQPDAKIVVVLWTAADIAKARARLSDAGVDEIATNVSEAIERLRQFAAPIGLTMKARGAVPA